MRSRNPRSSHKPALSESRLLGVVKRAWVIALLLAFVAAGLLIGDRHAGAQSRTAAVGQSAAAAQTGDASAQPTTTRISPVSVTTVNFQQLAEREAAAAATLSRSRVRRADTLVAARPPMTVNDSPQGAPVSSGDEVSAPAPSLQNDTGGPAAASPAPSQSFLAQEDGPKIGTTSFTIPPDTTGAVGLDKVFTQTNSNFRIHNKATGAALSTVNSDTFWASAGGTGVFDPQIQFDPYNNRWILAIVSNAQSASSSIEVAVSQTSDPQGSYFIFRFIVGCAAGTAGCNAGGEWADFPMLGFNRNWVAVAVNMFSISANASVNFKTLVLDYPTLRTGTANATIFAGAGIGFCAHPVTTYDPAQGTLFVPTHLSSGGATYKVNTITGTPAAPVYTVGATKTRPGGGWTQPGGDLLPQQCIPGVGAPTQTCPATIRKIDVGDAQIRSNPTFRSGQIYYAQTVGLPAGGLTRTAAQWTILNTAGDFVDGGRVDDPTATATNGGKWYAYPSITANKNGDVMMGFSEFESDDYADSGYTFRLASDAAGTMGDPFIYKDGEDYYSKTFSGTRNRWGDYSHTMIDPVNDRDLWTIQEYAQLRTGADGNASNDSRWGTFWAKITAPIGASDLKISEFRLRGPGGANDEFIEIYNNNNSSLTVNATDGSAGFAVAASDSVTRCTIPNGTVIPGRGHYLCTNSVAYSLSSYPAGNGTTATGDATYTTDIADNAGIALFNTATVANFATATRLDAVGFTSEANTLYKEGTGIPAINPTFNIDHAFYRDLCGKGGSITTLGACPTLGFPKDTDNNAVDFVFVDTNGTSAGAGQRLGAAGPENLSSPVQRNSQFSVVNLDATVGSGTPPNRVRDFTSDPANNSTFGTLDIRKRVVNNTGANVTRLRFRISALTTFPAPSGFADLRPRTSTAVVVTGINDAGTCSPAVTPCTVTVQGTTLETPPSQPNGGGFNSTLSADTVTLATPILPGGSVNVRFLLGIQQTGTFKFFVNVEALP